MTRKVHEENERIKRRYLTFLREAKRADHATVDKAAAAILWFEQSTGCKSFKRFHIDQATSFKRRLECDVSSRTGKPFSKATIDGTLRLAKAFFQWLSGQSGYKSRISYADAEYFNLNRKDARVAHTDRDTPYPTMEQCRHAFSLMPDRTAVEKRNRAIFAFVMLTGARDGAIASARLKHINLGEACFYQDARDVKTKFAKTFTTWFFPVDASYLDCLVEWITYLREDRLFGHNDALFPKPELGLVDGSFATIGFTRAAYGNAGKIREVIKSSFINAGLPPFVPHSFRKTLVKYGDQLCDTREQFKAWSQNLGHDSVVTTISAYCPVSNDRQAELIRKLGKGR
jgi:integrase/recombinase XerD